tara:strand:+ start:113 stop:229 length:117 start_codon:yes stop_codon:yes gene_type:complete
MKRTYKPKAKNETALKKYIKHATKKSYIRSSGSNSIKR